MTISNSLEEFIDILHLDPGSPEAEWEIVNTLLPPMQGEAVSALEWVFFQHQGYIDTRARAGLKLLEQSSERSWSILEQLVVSDKPDDRDTPLAVLSTLRSERAIGLAACLLDDPYPYVRLEAAEFLGPYLPDKVKSVLLDLLEHQEDWVQQKATSLLTAAGTDVHGR